MTGCSRLMANGDYWGLMGIYFHAINPSWGLLGIIGERAVGQKGIFLDFEKMGY